MRLPLTVSFVALLLFAVIAGQLATGHGFAVDRLLLMWFRNGAEPERPLGPAWVLKAARDFTALGGGPVLTLVTVLGIGYFLARCRRWLALVLALATSSGAWLNSLLKAGFVRARPDIVPHLVEVSSASFPSAHAMNSAVIYLTLATLLAMAEPSRHVRAYCMGVALSLVLMLGLTRVYLGVHWPTDVLAGWFVGTGWAAGWTALAVTVGRRLSSSTATGSG